jgi:hypothetical protein
MLLTRSLASLSPEILFIVIIAVVSCQQGTGAEAGCPHEASPNISYIEPVCTCERCNLTINFTINFSNPNDCNDADYRIDIYHHDQKPSSVCTCSGQCHLPLNFTINLTSYNNCISENYQLEVFHHNQELYLRPRPTIDSFDPSTNGSCHVSLVISNDTSFVGNGGHGSVLSPEYDNSTLQIIIIPVIPIEPLLLFKPRPTHNLDIHNTSSICNVSLIVDDATTFSNNDNTVLKQQYDNSTLQVLVKNAVQQPIIQLCSNNFTLRVQGVLDPVIRSSDYY